MTKTYVDARVPQRLRHHLAGERLGPRKETVVAFEEGDLFVAERLRPTSLDMRREVRGPGTCPTLAPCPGRVSGG